MSRGERFCWFLVGVFGGMLLYTLALIYFWTIYIWRA